MITVAQKEHIRTAYFCERKSIHQIARVFGHGRETIRKAIRDPSPPRYTRTKPPPKPVLGPFIPIIDEILKKDLTAPRKQRHTARRIYQRLCAEWGFQGGESTVRRYVSTRKADLGQGREVYLPMAHPPDGQAAMDWTPATVVLKGEPREVHLFLMELEHSNKRLCQAYPAEKQELLFDGQAGTFEYFGGVPPKIRYDNLKTAVKRVLTGKKREEQESFIAFRSHYLFQSDFCGVGRAHEKGTVENFAGYVKRNFLTPVPRVESFEELNEYLLVCCRKEDSRKLQGKRLTIGEAFEEERRSLLPLPKHSFECCQVVATGADSQSRVAFEGNRYSVPSRYAYREVTLKAFAWGVAISSGDEVIARHQRSYGKGEQILDPLHYLPLLERKPAGLDRGLPFQNWKIPEVFNRFRKALEERSPRGTKQYIKILRLLERYELSEIARVLEEAERLRVWDYDCVLNLLMSPRRDETSPRVLDLGDQPELAAVTGYRANITIYNALLGERR